LKKLEYDNVQPEILFTSQKGQESIINYTFECIGTTNKYYVELGAIDGHLYSNTANLRVNNGWSGLLIEGNPEIPSNPDINLHNRRIFKNNICEILKEFNVPKDHDFICIDLDGFDYWITKAVLEEYSPRVIMVETNVRFEPNQSWTLKYNENWDWDGSSWYGASPYAFKKMLNEFGYIPVWMHLDDMIVIRKDILKEKGYEVPEWNEVYSKSNKELYDNHTRGGYFINHLDLENWEEV
jgi:hypothetical protein